MDAGREITRRRKLSSGFREQLRTQRAAEPAHQSAISSEQRELLGAAIRALPTLYREPFVMRHLQGWSYAEIGDVLGMPVDTVETRLVRARRQLREALKDRI